jgi:hypothetical protein
MRQFTERLLLADGFPIIMSNLLFFGGFGKCFVTGSHKYYKAGMARHDTLRGLLLSVELFAPKKYISNA